MIKEAIQAQIDLLELIYKQDFIHAETNASKFIRQHISYYKQDLVNSKSIEDLQKEAFYAGQDATVMSNYLINFKYKTFNDYKNPTK